MTCWNSFFWERDEHDDDSKGPVEVQDTRVRLEYLGFLSKSGLLLTRAS
jgi:hypothetical protein